MSQYLSFTYPIYPNNKQKNLINRTFGCCRWMYNELLSRYIKAYELYKKEYDLDNTIKFKYKIENCGEIKREYYNTKPWLYDIDSLAYNYERIYLERAFSNFFRKLSKYPKFHKKGKDRDSYTTYNINKGDYNSIRFTINSITNGIRIILPKLGEVKVKTKYNPFYGIIKSVTIYRDSNNKYYISILSFIKEDINKPTKLSHEINLDNSIGFDYSSPNMFIDSNGNRGIELGIYRKYLKLINKHDKHLSRKVLHSNNYYKQKITNGKLHYHIKKIRKDICHRYSKYYTTHYDVLVFEDIDLRGISQSLKLGKSTMDNGYGIFRDMVYYKAKNQGVYSISINKDNTTQTCHRCGYIKKGDNKLKLSDKVYHCPICGLVYNRDYNAAINIKNKCKDINSIIEFKYRNANNIIHRSMYDNRYEQLYNTIESYNKIQKNNKIIYCYKEYGDTRPFVLANESSLEGSRKNSCSNSPKRRRRKT